MPFSSARLINILLPDEDSFMPSAEVMSLDYHKTLLS